MHYHHLCLFSCDHHLQSCRTKSLLGSRGYILHKCRHYSIVMQDSPSLHWPPGLGLKLILLVFLVINVTRGQDSVPAVNNHDHENNIPHHKINPYGCDCMEYWTCALSGGSMYSYCGIHAHDVCCFVPENAEPVGILPTPSRSRCGKKGFDSGHEGEADMAEWPWHVRSQPHFQTAAWPDI